MHDAFEQITSYDPYFAIMQLDSNNRCLCLTALLYVAMSVFMPGQYIYVHMIKAMSHTNSVVYIPTMLYNTVITAVTDPPVL